MDFSTVHNEYLHSAQWIYSVVMASGGVDPIVSTLSGAAEVANKQWISGRGAESNKPNGPAIAATSKQGRATRLHRIHLIWICWLKTFLSKKETQAGGHLTSSAVMLNYGLAIFSCWKLYGAKNMWLFAKIIMYYRVKLVLTMWVSWGNTYDRDLSELKPIKLKKREITC